jgi:hypothetical protein
MTICDMPALGSACGGRASRPPGGGETPPLREDHAPAIGRSATTNREKIIPPQAGRGRVAAGRGTTLHISAVRPARNRRMFSTTIGMT